jgi:hypothetical protein
MNMKTATTAKEIFERGNVNAILALPGSTCIDVGTSSCTNVVYQAECYQPCNCYISR